MVGQSIEETESEVDDDDLQENAQGTGIEKDIHGFLHIGFAITNLDQINVLEGNSHFNFAKIKKPGKEQRRSSEPINKKLIQEEKDFRSNTRGTALLKVDKRTIEALKGMGPHDKMLLSLFTGPNNQVRSESFVNQ